MAAFLGSKKSENKPSKITVCCSCKKEGIEVEYCNINIIPTGYKGRVSFYVECPLCGEKIYIDREKLSKSFVNKKYREIGIY